MLRQYGLILASISFAWSQLWTLFASRSSASKVKPLGQFPAIVTSRLITDAHALS